MNFRLKNVNNNIVSQKNLIFLVFYRAAMMRAAMVSWASANDCSQVPSMRWTKLLENNRTTRLQLFTKLGLDDDRWWGLQPYHSGTLYVFVKMPRWVWCDEQAGRAHPLPSKGQLHGWNMDAGEVGWKQDAFGGVVNGGRLRSATAEPHRRSHRTTNMLVWRLTKRSKVVHLSVEWCWEFMNCVLQR